MINETLASGVTPIANIIAPIINMLNILLGGVFGLYLILVILRWKEARTIKKILIEIKDELKTINKRLVFVEKSHKNNKKK